MSKKRDGKNQSVLMLTKDDFMAGQELNKTVRVLAGLSKKRGLFFADEIANGFSDAPEEFQAVSESHCREIEKLARKKLYSKSVLSALAARANSENLLTQQDIVEAWVDDSATAARLIWCSPSRLRWVAKMANEVNELESEST